MGYCPFPALCSDRVGAARTTGVCAPSAGDLSSLARRAKQSLSRQKDLCCDKPPWFLCCNREFSVATEFVQPSVKTEVFVP